MRSPFPRMDPYLEYPEVWPEVHSRFNLQDEIPIFPLALRSGDVEPSVNLKQILEGVYERAGYDLRIDYSQTTTPALSPADEAWVDKMLREMGALS